VSLSAAIAHATPRVSEKDLYMALVHDLNRERAQNCSPAFSARANGANVTWQTGTSGECIPGDKACRERQNVQFCSASRIRPSSAPLNRLGANLGRQALTTRKRLSSLQLMEDRTTNLLRACRPIPAHEPKIRVRKPRRRVHGQPVGRSYAPFRVKKWGIRGVVHWLESAGLGSYAPGFVYRGVTGPDLLSCEEDDLVICGVDFRPHRMRILRDVYAWRERENAKVPKGTSRSRPKVSKLDTDRVVPVAEYRCSGKEGNRSLKCFEEDEGREAMRYESDFVEESESPQGGIQITLSDLRGRDFLQAPGGSDPYLRITVGQNSARSEALQDADIECQWQTSLVICGVPWASMLNQGLSLEVWDEGAAEDKLVASGWLAGRELARLSASVTVPIHVALCATANGTSAGHILATLTIRMRNASDTSQEQEQNSALRARHHAASRIQAVVRGVRARGRKSEQLKANLAAARLRKCEDLAAIKIQALWRRHMAIRRFLHAAAGNHAKLQEDLREANKPTFEDEEDGGEGEDELGPLPDIDAAAIRIQSFQRGRVARRMIAFEISERMEVNAAAARRIQAQARGVAARKVAREQRKEDAATKIQAAVRGSRERRLVAQTQAASRSKQKSEELKRNEAAVTVQAVVRGHIERREQQAWQASRLRADAATKIQALQRGRDVRIRNRSLRRKSLERLEALWESKMVAAKRSAEEMAAVGTVTEFRPQEVHEVGAVSEGVDDTVEGHGAAAWQELADPTTGHKYFYNPRTRESLWELPDMSAFQQLAANHASSLPEERGSAEMSLDIFSNWVEMIDTNTGQTYYVNSTSGETSWELPSEQVVQGADIDDEASDYSVNLGGLFGL
jgi:hypothetical protein